MPTAAFDNRGFYRALDAERTARGLTWRQVAEAARVSASTLTRMGQGRRPDVDSLAALCRWSGLDADAFMRPRGESKDAPEPLALISSSLRSDPNLSADAADLIDELVKTTYARLRTS